MLHLQSLEVTRLKPILCSFSTARVVDLTVIEVLDSFASSRRYRQLACVGAQADNDMQYDW